MQPMLLPLRQGLRLLVLVLLVLLELLAPLVRLALLVLLVLLVLLEPGCGVGLCPSVPLESQTQQAKRL